MRRPRPPADFVLPLRPSPQKIDLRALIGNRTELLAASLGINILSLALPMVMLHIYDRIIPNAATATLLLLLGGLGIAFLLDAALSLARAYIAGWNAARIRFKLGTAAMARLLETDLSTLERSAPGVHLDRLRATDTLRGFFGGQPLLLLVDVPFGLLFLGMIAVIGGPLVLVPVAMTAAITVAAIWSGRRLRAAVLERSATDERRYNFIIETLKGVTTVKALGLETLMARRYERLVASSAMASHDVTLHGNEARIIAVMGSEVMMTAVAAYGAVLVMDGGLSSGALAACMLLAGRAAQPLLRTFGVWTQYQNARIARGRLGATLALPVGVARGSLGAAEGGLRCEGVAFAYGDGESPFLKQIDLEAGPGETIAISGPIGSGKTTLLLLIRGIIAPRAGTIRIGARNVADVSAATLARAICYLPQNATIFQGTILENMTLFGNAAAAERAIALADRLGIDEIIRRLPKGYETVVGDGPYDGVTGGVRQRIAIVRALTIAPEPRVLLFDEANSYLDLSSDARLCALLAELRGSCTSIIVSHRPSYARLADRRFKLENGILVPLVPHGGAAAPRQLAETSA